MDDDESNAKFDHLVLVDNIACHGNLLTQIPSVKNLQMLTALWLSDNKISRIQAGAFRGAARLLSLHLGGNHITFVAAGAFADLAALRVPQDQIAPWYDSFGVGLWLHRGAGYVGGGEDYSSPPIAFAPNPSRCVSNGPKVTDLDCTSCDLGFETASATNTTCVKPDFGPYRGWAANYSRLRLRDTRGSAIERNASTDALVLLTEHTYTIPAPQLEPKEQRFVGYTQPHTKIHYELDFSRGVDVEIGCGTTVVGDSTRDGTISKTNSAHPNNMHRVSYAWPTGRGDSKAGLAGFYPQKCPRYHRFQVVRSGHVTFDTCGSMATFGVSIYKATSNLSESEPHIRRLDLGGESTGQLYEVPLHDNNRQGTPVRTGLVKVQPDQFSAVSADWLRPFADPDYPAIEYPDHSTFTAVNGCPLSKGANRTYVLQAGNYVLETMGADLQGGCTHFSVKMSCSQGAETTSPKESDPLGFSVDANTGAITGTPQKVRDGYKMRLRAVDVADVRTNVAEWTFNVKPSPKFSISPAAAWSAENDRRLKSKYHVGDTHLLPKPRLNTTSLLQHPAGGRFDQVVYLLSAQAADGNPKCAGGSKARAVSALTDVATGEGAINIKCEGHYNAKLVVRDGAGKEVTVRSWNFTARRRDTGVVEYGPGGRGCANGGSVDGEPMDGAFTCDCSGTRFTGQNCETASEQDDTAAAVVGAVLGVLGLAAAVVFLLLRWQRHQRSMMATDFSTQLELMKERGEVDQEQLSKDRVPRELKRSGLSLIDQLGQGAFGEVWKGLLTDGDNTTSIPEFLVAAKTVKAGQGMDTSGAAAAEEELLKEALLMAQVENHVHLVSLVGVVTRGRPKVLVISFCEHGELQGRLKKRGADGEAFDLACKYRFCKEIGDGMAHLARHNFVHRDLAARNVLLGTGMVCKVADFGLSRRVQTEDNTGDYYRSSSGIIPVRWTAPEGITSQKFSSASDVWSYGITCVEIFLDGARPYPGIASNPEVVREYTQRRGTAAAAVAQRGARVLCVIMDDRRC